MAETFGILCRELVSLDFRCGSKLPLRGAIDPRPELGAQPKQIARKLTFALECPKLEVFSPWPESGQQAKK